MSALDELLLWYATLDAASLAALERYYDPQARFRDPFNDVAGTPAIRRIFEHMFATTEAPRFVIGERLPAERQAFVTWEFELGLGGRRLAIPGSSHLRFGADGRVLVHRDYWDAADLWAQLPLLGTPVAWLRRRFATAQR